MCGINPAKFRTGGQTAKWTCPRGHDEEDDTPLLPRAFCRACDEADVWGGGWYEWDEVTQRGPAESQERVPMPAGLLQEV